MPHIRFKTLHMGHFEMRCTPHAVEYCVGTESCTGCNLRCNEGIQKYFNIHYDETNRNIPYFTHMVWKPRSCTQF